MNKERLQFLSITTFLLFVLIFGDKILSNAALFTYPSSRKPVETSFFSASTVAQSSSVINNLLFPSQSSSENSTKDLSSKLSSRKNNLFIRNPLPLLQLNAPRFTILSIIANQSNTPKPPVTTQTASSSTKIATSSSSSKPINPITTIIQQVTPPQKTITEIINNIPDNSVSNSIPENSVVNILCKITQNGLIKNISSSGILISNDGTILTNAHVGIHPFLDTYSGFPITCLLKTGSPAQGGYPLSLIYISSSWTAKHQGEINGSISPDSGEHDFAILKTNDLKNISGAQKISIRNSRNSLSFNEFSGNINNLSTGQAIKIIGYPLTQNNSSISRKVEELQISSFFGFNGSNAKDIIETSVSSVGKSGSSGGAIIDNQKYLVGLVSNTVFAGSGSNETKVHALTLDYVNKALVSETGLGLEDIINGKSSTLKDIFENKYLNLVSTHLLQSK